MDICHPIASSIENISSKLTDAERLVRHTIMNEIIDSGLSLGSSALEMLGNRGGIDIAATVSVLEKKHVFGRDNKGSIAYVYPVSAHPTQHKVTLKDGRHFHAMCAIDSLGCAFTFKQDISIESSCSYCKAPVSVTIQNGKLSSHLPQDLQVLRYNLNTIANIHVDR